MPMPAETGGGPKGPEVARPLRLVTESVSAARSCGFLVDKAKSEAGRIGWEYTGREGLKERVKDALLADVLVFGSDGVRLSRYAEGLKKASFRFHPSTAPLRIGNLLKGGSDVMAGAMGLGDGDSVLDCTMGIGSDAIVASFVVGCRGSVKALEASEEIFTAVDMGMREYRGDARIEGAISRILRSRESYRKALMGMPDGSFDIVYMDPMFQTKVSSANPIDAIRTWACGDYPSREDLLEAARVARRRFVMKVRKGERGSLPYDMGRMTVFHSSHAGPVEYIGIEKGGML